MTPFDTDEMAHNVTFHLGLHCYLMYALWSNNIKGLIVQLQNIAYQFLKTRGRNMTVILRISKFYKNSIYHNMCFCGEIC